MTAGWPRARSQLATQDLAEDWSSVMIAECPVCEAEVEIPDDAEEGEIIECADCGAELEIASVDPPELVEAPEEEEDWGQ